MEIWRAIPGLPTYEASDLGTVRRVRPGVPQRVIAPQLVRGYYRVSVRSGSRWKLVPVHRLVGFAFRGLPTGDRRYCNHIDGDKLNNRPSNLEWVTSSENSLHAYRIGLRVSPRAGSPGERNGRARLSESQVRDLLARHHSGASARSLARNFGIAYCTAKKIVSGRLWSHIERRTA